MPLARLLRRLLPLLFLVGLGWFLWRKVSPALDGLNVLGDSEPKVTVTHNTVLTQVESLGRLELVRYRFKDVVEYKRRTYRYLPESKAALIVAGEAIGCLDLRKLRPEDVILEGDSIVRVFLPKPELCTFQIDHSQSRVFSTENGYLQDADLVDEGYRYAEAQVRRAALQSGILPQTQRNAEQILLPMLRTLTGRRVVLAQRLEMPAPARKG
ncbi:DUF4230 domain-containing protein [Hymenobacter sp. ASUV-10]|uniref:DUF4230 domain-containing protein n=1 Tax=Hymenobacter aranciens TaxID=3063996 RepID=A0ABT9BBP1_9BACT|nr:DUF4230 domain-containing protein [Hymenobacter sp. ASUV-10]MDO7875109.1 DUF4230 domain-containing protein [Hymenobacter sp. ASUV-10]